MTAQGIAALLGGPIRVHSTGDAGHIYVVQLECGRNTPTLVFTCNHDQVNWNGPILRSQPCRPDTCCKHAIHVAELLTKTRTLRKIREIGDLWRYEITPAAQQFLEMRRQQAERQPAQENPPHEPTGHAD